jgi:hypothetical protein
MEVVMKKTAKMMVVLGIVLLGAVIAASAATAPRMRVNIGFTFYAGEQQLPAGEYWVELRSTDSYSATGSLLVIRSLDESAYQMLLAKPESQHMDDSAAYLLFNRIGDSYFLIKAHSGSIDSNVFKSRSEKQVKMAFARDWLSDSAEVVKVLATR